MHAGACEARSLAVGSRRAELSSVRCTAGSPGPTLSSIEQVLCAHFTNEQMMHVGRQENGFGLFFPLFPAKNPELATRLCHPLSLLRGLNTDKGRNGERGRLWVRENVSSETASQIFSQISFLLLSLHMHRHSISITHTLAQSREMYFFLIKNAS